MWYLNLHERESGKLAVEVYASFESYEEAFDFGRRHEMEFRACGWMYVVMMAE